MIRKQQGTILWFDVRDGVGRVQLEKTIAPITATMIDGVSYDYYTYPSVADEKRLMELHGREIEAEVSGIEELHTMRVTKITLKPTGL